MNIESYFKIAKSESNLSNCLRRRIGAVIVKNGDVVGRGANRSKEQITPCSEKGWCIRDVLNIPRGKGYDVCNSIHAEINAIISASDESLKDSTMYLVGYDAVTGKTVENLDCCKNCKASIVKVGIKMVYIKQSDNQYSRVIVKNGFKQSKLFEMDSNHSGGEHQKY